MLFGLHVPELIFTLIVFAVLITVPVLAIVALFYLIQYLRKKNRDL